MFDFLREDEKAVLLDILSSINKAKLESKEAKQLRKVVPIEKWINDPFYVGAPGMALYPFWKNQMIEIFKDRPNGEEINEVIIDGAIGCRPWNMSRLQTNKGWLTCEELSEYDYEYHNTVFVESGEGPKQVNDVLLKGKGSVRTLVLTMSDGSKFEGTEDHLLRIRQSDEWIWRKLRDFSVGNKIQKKYISSEYPEIDVDKNEAYVIGYLMLRSILNSNEITVFISQENVNSNVEDTIYEYFINSVFTLVKDDTQFKCGRTYRVESLEGIDHIMDCFGMGRFPKCVYKYSKHDMLEFVAGVFDAVSEVNKWGKNCIRIQNASSILIKMQQILANLGIFSEIEGGEVYDSLTIRDEMSLFRFVKMVPCRSNRIKKWAKKIRVRRVQEFYETEVVSIEESVAVCGDISVSDNHQYIMEGIINHNTGKSTCAVFCMVRKIYELSCWANIPGLFNLMPGSLIAFIYFSISKTQAELTGYGQIKNIIDQIPYFQQYFRRNERIQSMMVFPENVLLLYGSETGHSTGLNMIGCILDEANFRQANAQMADRVQVDNGKVETMYTSILNRGASRFLGNGRNASLAILVSSNTTSSSFTEQRKKQARTNLHTMIINARLWDVKPKGTYDSEGFWVFVGSDVIDACICDVPEDVYQFTDSVNYERILGSVEEIIGSLPETFKEYFTWAPNDFRKQYEDNLIMSLQDLSGYSVAPTGRLFNSRPAYVKACDSPYTHPFTKNTFILSTQDNIHLKDYIRSDYYPLNRDKPRYIHIDQSLAHDRTGVGSVYCHHWEKDEVTGIYKPYYVNDIQMSVAPPKAPRKISIKKCFELIFYMRDVWKLPIGMVTYDSYASAGAQQELEANDIPCGTLSVDRTDEQYIYLAECLLSGQIKMYHHPVFDTELFNLIHYRGLHKVDHPKAYYGTGDNSNQTWGGSKDLTDGVAGALWNCYLGSKEEQNNKATAEDYKEIYSHLDIEDDEYSMRELTGSDIFTEDDMGLGGW